MACFGGRGPRFDLFLFEKTKERSAHNCPEVVVTTLFEKTPSAVHFRLRTCFHDSATEGWAAGLKKRPPHVCFVFLTRILWRSETFPENVKKFLL